MANLEQVEILLQDALDKIKEIRRIVTDGGTDDGNDGD